MRSNASIVKEYIVELPDERREDLTKFHYAIVENLPEEFAVEMSYGMIGYVVPHELSPVGCHVDPRKPLSFMNLAS